jgi:hypothetical protein
LSVGGSGSVWSVGGQIENMHFGAPPVGEIERIDVAAMYAALAVGTTGIR